jgi:hypothetical protein
VCGLVESAIYRGLAEICCLHPRGSIKICKGKPPRYMDWTKEQGSVSEPMREGGTKTRWLLTVFITDPKRNSVLMP